MDLVEGLHDGRFYALKRIICHDKDDRQEAMHEVEMHLLFEHPNILTLCAHAMVERGSKHEAWLLLPFLKVSVGVRCRWIQQCMLGNVVFVATSCKAERCCILGP